MEDQELDRLDRLNRSSKLDSGFNSRLNNKKGRGTVLNPPNRFSPIRLVPEDDGWSRMNADHGAECCTNTEVCPEYAKTIVTKNNSPDVPFDFSINPYRGCEHGCIYCFARPTHSFWDLSPGLDFETKLFYKPNARELLVHKLSQPGYCCEPIVIGTNTDPYQPIDRVYRITRELLATLNDFNHPVSLITKGALIERDIDILTEMAEKNLCSVIVSVTTLDNDLKTRLEPRAASPQARLRVIRNLAQAGIPVGILMAPIIPMTNDMEIESLLSQCRDSGAQSAGYVFLRLPHEVKELFYQWLFVHYPDRAKHVISLIRQSRGGSDYQSEFGSRMRAKGVYADLIKRRFELACKKLGFGSREERSLSCELFRVPVDREGQLGLF